MFLIPLSLPWRLTSIFTILFTIIACSHTTPIKRPHPLPQNPYIQVYFNQNQAQGADYTDPYRNIKREGDNLEQIMIDAINKAQSTIDVAVLEFRLPALAKALAKRHQDGVKVRVIIDDRYNNTINELSSNKIEELTEREEERYSDYMALVDLNKDQKLTADEINQRDAIAILREAGIPIIDDREDGSKGSGLMHHKFMIIDGNTVIISSANFTLSDIHGDFLNPQSRGNNNHIVVINNNEIAKIFGEQFNVMWGDGTGVKKDSKFGIDKPNKSPQTVKIEDSEITVKFSPISPTQLWSLSSNGLIAQTLDGANSSVDLSLFVFSEQKLADILEKKHQQGVPIKTLIDSDFAFRYFSEGLDMLGVAISHKCSYEKDNNPWRNPIKTVGIPRLQPGDKLHHKFGIIDKKIVITGSHNWSAAANHLNDETLLIIKSPLVAAHFQREFERLYSNAIVGIPDYVTKQIEEDQQKCPKFYTPTSEDNNGKLINLNTATQEELETLPGIGASLAQRIIQARGQQPFSSLEDLKRVPGIGKSKLRKLEGKVTW